MPDVRFDRGWDSWDGSVRAGKTHREILGTTSDPDLVSLLASTRGHFRSVDRNVVATELLNRIRRHEHLASHAGEGRLAVWESAMATEDRCFESRERIRLARQLAHHTRIIVRASRRRVAMARREPPDSGLEGPFREVDAP